MKLHISGLHDYCGEAETVGYVVINSTGNGVVRNIKDAHRKLQLSSIKSVLNDEILFSSILANINRKIIAVSI
jgi:hypothetical protein